MRLSDVSFDEFALGDRCISAIGNPGQIVGISRRNEMIFIPEWYSIDGRRKNTSPRLMKALCDTVLILWHTNTISMIMFDDIDDGQYIQWLGQ